MLNKLSFCITYISTPRSVTWTIPSYQQRVQINPIPLSPTSSPSLQVLFWEDTYISTVRMAPTRVSALVLFLFMFSTVLSPAERREVVEAARAADARRPRRSGGRDGKAIDQGIGYFLMALALVLTYVLHWEQLGFALDAGEGFVWFQLCALVD